MRYFVHALSLAVVLGAASGVQAKPAYVASTVNLRAAPGTGSEIVAKIPGGSLVDAGGCTEGWCEVSWQDKKGFAIQTALDLSGRVPQRRPVAPRVYEDGPDYVEGPPVYYGPPPVYYRPYYRPYWGWHRHWW